MYVSCPPLSGTSPFPQSDTETVVLWDGKLKLDETDVLIDTLLYIFYRATDANLPSIENANSIAARGSFGAKICIFRPQYRPYYETKKKNEKYVIYNDTRMHPIVLIKWYEEI